MKVLVISILLSALFLSDSFATHAAKTINPEDEYEESSTHRRQPRQEPKKTQENEEEEFIHEEDTFVG